MIWEAKPLVLASASPRRRDLLAAAGISFRVVESGFDETSLPGEAPADMVERLALEKARAVSAIEPHSWVLAADTIVVHEGQVFGKPASATDALEMLQALQGSEHEVLGGVAILAPGAASERSFCSRTRVVFAAIETQEIERYVATGEPLDKAGAYAIQGIASQFVREVRGSYSNVVGLDVARVVEELKALGVLRLATSESERGA